MEHIAPSSDRAALTLISDFSLEMTGKDVPGLLAARGAIPQGTRINVTYLGGEDLDLRVEAARTVKELGFTPVPHISARRTRSEEELETFLRRLQAVGATERVLVIGGDPTTPEGPYPDALSIIRTGLLEAHGVREVGIAGYPEGHPDIANGVLWQHLEDKVAELKTRGLDTVILTQFAFDAEPVVEWVRAVRARGIEAPIRLGVPGPAGIKRLLGFARRFGVGANAMIVKKYGFSLTNLMGTAGPDRFLTELASDLLAGGVDAGIHVHLYTFGGLEATAEWAQRFIDSRRAASS